MDSQYDMYRISALRWWVSHEPNVARDKCLEVLAGPPNEPLKNEATRQLGVLKDAPGEHRVFDVLMRLAALPSYANRQAAVSSLASYGDPRAIPVIEPLTKSSLFFTRRAAASAIARLRAGH